MIAAEAVKAGSSGWRLAGAPGRLMAICVVQLAMVAVGTLSTVHVKMCDVSSGGDGGSHIDCDSCGSSVFDAREGLLLAGGALAVGCGIAAAWRRSKRLAKVYATCMLLYAFLIGLTAVLSGVEVPSLQGAVDRVKGNPACKRTAQAMVNAIRDRAVLYGVNALLDAAGAYWAIRSKESFEYREIQDRARRDTALLDASL